jgi:hypothetical protein
MYVYANVTSFLIEILLEMKRHLATATADVQHTLVWSQVRERPQVAHKLRA